MKGERRGVMIGTVCHFALFQLKELIVVEHGEKRIGKERKGKTTFAHVSVSERNDTPEVPEQSRVSATAVKPLSITLPPTEPRRVLFPRLLPITHFTCPPPYYMDDIPISRPPF